MPTYHMVCDNCKIDYEIKRSFAEGVPKTCEQCGEAVKQIYHPFYAMSGTPRTLGILAEKNTANLGTYERDKLYKQQAESKERARTEARKQMKLPEGMKSIRPAQSVTPWWREGDKGPNLKLADLAPRVSGTKKEPKVEPLSEKAIKYIVEGKT